MNRTNRAFWQMIQGVTNELEISEEQIIKILNISKEHYLQCKELEEIQTKEELLNYLAIYNCLSSFYVNKDAPKKWMHTINPSFENKTPLDLILNNNEGLKLVLNYLRMLMNGP